MEKRTLGFYAIYRNSAKEELEDIMSDTPVREMTWKEEIESLEISDNAKERIIWKIENEAQKQAANQYSECLRNELEDLRNKYKKACNNCAELKTENTHLRDVLEEKENAVQEKPCPSVEWYESRYQSDCVTINQLNVTIDTLIDKIALLRKNAGLS